MNIFIVTPVRAVHITQHYKDRAESFPLKRLLRESESLPLGTRALRYINPHLKWASDKVWNRKTIQVYHHKNTLTETECQAATGAAQGLNREKITFKKKLKSVMQIAIDLGPFVASSKI